MQKRSLIKLFNPGTHNHKIVKHILKHGYMHNYEIPKTYPEILNLTRRISEIRIKLRANGHDIVFMKEGNLYIIEKWKT